MTIKLTLPRFAAVGTLALTISCTMAQEPVQAQEGNSMLPKYFDGMTLLEENNCPSFTVKYYATPAVTVAELKNPDMDKGYGFIVLPKDGVRLTEVLRSSAQPKVISGNYFITYQPPGQQPREISANARDHPAAPESAMIPSPLFNEGGVFYAGPSYHDVLAHSTNGMYGQGTITIDVSAVSARGTDLRL